MMRMMQGMRGRTIVRDVSSLVAHAREKERSQNETIGRTLLLVKHVKHRGSDRPTKTAGADADIRHNRDNSNIGAAHPIRGRKDVQRYHTDWSINGVRFPTSPPDSL
jgi:hypothetical protein